MDDDKDIIVGSSDLDTLTITIDNDTIDLTSMANSLNYNYGTVITNGTGPYNIPTPYNSNYTFNTTTPSSGLHVSGDAEFEGDLKIKGRSILKTLEAIEKRLSILQPDPEKLEHFEALRKAYEHYKTLEALCEIPKKTED